MFMEIQLFTMGQNPHGLKLSTVMFMEIQLFTTTGQKPHGLKLSPLMFMARKPHSLSYIPGLPLAETLCYLCVPQYIKNNDNDIKNKHRLIIKK